jgi:hypothetical protein
VPFLIEYATDAVFLAALMALGLWLEGINGKHGVFDEWLAPVPLGVSGGILLCLERALG